MALASPHEGERVGLCPLRGDELVEIAQSPLLFACLQQQFTTKSLGRVHPHLVLDAPVEIGQSLFILAFFVSDDPARQCRDRRLGTEFGNGCHINEGLIRAV